MAIALLLAAAPPPPAPPPPRGCGPPTSDSGGSPPAARAVAEPAWLERLNEVRTSSGLPPVRADAGGVSGLAQHLTYLAKTPDRLRSGAFASGHSENPSSPWYSAAGAKAGSRSNIAYGTSDGPNAIDQWMAAPFHAIGMLRPGLRSVAFARDSASGNAGLDIISGLDSDVPIRKPILFPGHESVTDLRTFDGERPNPIETCTRASPRADYSSPSLPMIALLPQAPSTNLVARLTDPDGRVVSSASADLCVITASTYYSTDPVHGANGRKTLAGDNAVVVIARRPFESGLYQVSLSQPGRDDVVWRFVYSTRPLQRATHRAQVRRSADVTMTAVSKVVRTRQAGTVSRRLAVTVDGRRYVGRGTAPVVVVASIERRVAVTRSAVAARTARVTCVAVTRLLALNCAKTHAVDAAASVALSQARREAATLARRLARARARELATADAEREVRRAPSNAERQSAATLAERRAAESIRRQLGL
ncbi:CAP domain-containing protein [Nocardioides sp. R-C-SC26]|uniref:CAP domain-containing protein n=1 Tax=Nocardioides sp. R-C-SC26 TaxID=2870414 RepID=UPI001E5A7D99|nr:CAP domain-containing protein [Nocardioides sp. R-C-SC26]